MDNFFAFIFQSVPEAFIKLFFAICLLKPTLLPTNWRGLVIYSISTSIISYIFRYFNLQMELWIVVLFFLSIIITRFSFPISWYLSLLLNTVSYIVQLIGEFIILYLADTIFNLSLIQVQQTLIYRIGLPYLYLIPLILLALYFKKHHFHIKEKWVNHKYKWGLPLISLQLVLGLMIHALYFIPNDSYYTFFIRFPILTIAMVLVSIIFFIYVNHIQQKEIHDHITYAEKPLIDELEKMIEQWRSYRHDFHNHIEVLYILMDEEKYAEAKQYMTNFHNKVIESQSLFPFKQPAIQALLKAKMVQAEEKGIQLAVKSEEILIFPQMKSYDIVLILGNIIDNAIDALYDSNQQLKQIEISYQKVLNIFLLEISNNGPMIPPELKEKLFTKSFSTKTEKKHQGMGLPTIYKIVESYNGEISVQSDENTTNFQVAIFTDT
ncbi:histidine kinase [Schinkia azotoformans MEV2011]|uniref:Histidine kinase n=1 Tax=Schinkia azotoformans MEV2011 TaxID=1348973 RepID=A0A072NUD6_SCHAZ|nr:GHKL domain-containing protein [Schinkia azotoformans]KEF36865.1 histidine kinase [Schinkia azotoformans MEV2011]MEC1695240.1 GHKL domain-containing protein [Schinkia azotoformans]MEC1723697.1 GHKL domain-containing protein [Schinkia azotoformans]MEC1772682.1 GHKL domain-containing protein [Schinkia azotoformans]MEC1778486.1 GHKL domain-containing protein [Schinkia azotoformans]